MLAMGNPESSHRSHSIKPYYESVEHTTEGIYAPTLNRYGEVASRRIAGIVWQGVHYLTRKHVWTLYKMQDDEDVTGRGEARAQRSSSHGEVGFLGKTIKPFVKLYGFQR